MKQAEGEEEKIIRCLNDYFLYPCGFCVFCFLHYLLVNMRFFHFFVEPKLDTSLSYHFGLFNHILPLASPRFWFDLKRIECYETVFNSKRWFEKEFTYKSRYVQYE